MYLSTEMSPLTGQNPRTYSDWEMPRGVVHVVLTYLPHEEDEVTPTHPITVESFVHGNTLYRASSPLAFQCALRSGIYTLSGPFGIVLSHESVDILVEEMVPEFLEYLWEEYALEDEAALDGPARKLRSALLECFEAEEGA
jgi:hypothetical protein